jgi:hypothetical protein
MGMAVPVTNAEFSLDNQPIAFTTSATFPNLDAFFPHWPVDQDL